MHFVTLSYTSKIGNRTDDHFVHVIVNMDGWADENWNGIVQDEETWIDVRISNFKEIYDRGNGLFLSDDDKEETKKL